MSDYWEESLKEIFSDHNLKLTPEIISDIIMTAEMESEATGMVNIPNPMCSEVDRLKATIREMESAHNNQVSGILKGVASRRNVSVSDVHVDGNGNITYYK